MENNIYEVPSQCYLSFLKYNKIEALEGNYMLVCHPMPMVEGEMLIMHYHVEDLKKEKDLIVYRDYSLVKRLPSQEKARDEQFKNKKKKPKEEDNVDPKLQCLDIDLEMPLNGVEWRNLADVINEVKGLAWFQVLPVGQKSSMPMQFNVLHVLPNKKIPVKTLPLDLFISNAVSYQRKTERNSEMPKEE